MSDHIERLIESVAELKAASEFQTETVERMHHRLFGNGQPGVIKDLEESIEALEAGSMKKKAGAEALERLWRVELAAAVVTGGGILFTW